MEPLNWPLAVLLMFLGLCFTIIVAGWPKFRPREDSSRGGVPALPAFPPVAKNFPPPRNVHIISCEGEWAKDRETDISVVESEDGQSFFFEFLAYGVPEYAWFRLELQSGRNYEGNLTFTTVDYFVEIKDSETVDELISRSPIIQHVLSNIRMCNSALGTGYANPQVYKTSQGFAVGRFNSFELQNFRGSTPEVNFSWKPAPAQE